MKTKQNSPDFTASLKFKRPVTVFGLRFACTLDPLSSSPPSFVSWTVWSSLFFSASSSCSFRSQPHSQMRILKSWMHWRRTLRLLSQNRLSSSSPKLEQIFSIYTVHVRVHVQAQSTQFYRWINMQMCHFRGALWTFSQWVALMNRNKNSSNCVQSKSMLVWYKYFPAKIEYIEKQRPLGVKKN